MSRAPTWLPVSSTRRSYAARGHNAERMAGRFGGLQAEEQDPDNVRYWAISPEELATHVVYAIDQPAGLAISDITVRATGEDFVF